MRGAGGSVEVITKTRADEVKPGSGKSDRIERFAARFKAKFKVKASPRRK